MCLLANSSSSPSYSSAGCWVFQWASQDGHSHPRHVLHPGVWISSAGDLDVQQINLAYAGAIKPSLYVEQTHTQRAKKHMGAHHVGRSTHWAAGGGWGKGRQNLHSQLKTHKSRSRNARWERITTTLQELMRGIEELLRTQDRVRRRYQVVAGVFEQRSVVLSKEEKNRSTTSNARLDGTAGPPFLLVSLTCGSSSSRILSDLRAPAKVPRTQLNPLFPSSSPPSDSFCF